MDPAHISRFLSYLTILGQLTIIFLLLLIFLPFKKRSFIFSFFSKNSYIFSFIVALMATSGSLYYSEIAGFTPCILCWYQRILMYPQVPLLAVALWKNEKIITDYILTLSLLGAPLSIYHYLLQLGLVPNISCSAVGFSISCAEKFVMNFGYITIPLMAATAFVMISLFMLLFKRSKNF